MDEALSECRDLVVVEVQFLEGDELAEVLWELVVVEGQLLEVGELAEVFRDSGELIVGEV